MWNKIIIHSPGIDKTHPELEWIVDNVKQKYEQKYNKSLGQFHVFINEKDPLSGPNVWTTAKIISKDFVEIIIFSEGYLRYFNPISCHDELEVSIAHEFAHIFKKHNVWIWRLETVIFALNVYGLSLIVYYFILFRDQFTAFLEIIIFLAILIAELRCLNFIKCWTEDKADDEAILITNKPKAVKNSLKRLKEIRNEKETIIGKIIGYDHPSIDDMITRIKV